MKSFNNIPSTTKKGKLTCIGICFAGPIAKSQAFLERKEFNAMAFSSSASVGAMAFVFCFLDVDATGSAEVKFGGLGINLGLLEREMLVLAFWRRFRIRKR